MSKRSGAKQRNGAGSVLAQNFRAGSNPVLGTHIFFPQLLSCVGGFFMPEKTEPARLLLVAAMESLSFKTINLQ